MSFYSSLSLIADTGVRAPTKEEVHQLFTDTHVLEPSRAKNDFYNLADDLIAFFTEHKARKENPRFFTPDTISFVPMIKLLHPEGYYDARGFTITIHGNGYFYPLERNDFAPFLTSPKIVSLRTEAQRRFGGRFSQSLIKDQKVLQHALLNADGDWCWFGSQSM